MEDDPGYKPVIIDWHDAHAYSEHWTTLEEIDEEPCLVRTAGWLLPDAKPGHVVIAQSYSSLEGIDCVLCIPVAMVVKTQLL